MNTISKIMLITVIGLVLFCSFVAFVLSFIPDASDVDIRNTYIGRLEKELDFQRTLHALFPLYKTS